MFISENYDYWNEYERPYHIYLLVWKPVKRLKMVALEILKELKVL